MTNAVQKNTMIASASFLTGAYLAWNYDAKAGAALMAASAFLVREHLPSIQELSLAASAARIAYSTHGACAALDAGIRTLFCKTNGASKHSDFSKKVSELASDFKAGKGLKELASRWTALKAVYSNFTAADKEALKTSIAQFGKIGKAIKAKQAQGKDQKQSEATVSTQRPKPPLEGAAVVTGPTFPVPLQGAGFRITLAQGDFLAQAESLGTTGVMYGANPKLVTGSYTAGDIFNNAKSGLDQYIGDTYPTINADKHRLQFGETVVTPSFALSDKGITHIVHTVGPIYNRNLTPQENEKLLRNAIVKSLIKANKEKVRSLTLIPLSSGIYGFRKDVSIRITLEVLREIRAKSPKAFDHIVLDIFDMNDYLKTVANVQQGSEKTTSTVSISAPSRPVRRIGFVPQNDHERFLCKMADEVGFIPFYKPTQPVIRQYSGFKPYLTADFGNFASYTVNMEMDIQPGNPYGRTYPNPESAFHGGKTEDPITRDDLCRADGDRAVRIGKSAPMEISSTDWDQTIRFARMLQVKRRQAAQNEKYRFLLLATKDAYLVEHPPVVGRDDVWADGHLGKKHAGQLPRKVRFQDPDSATPKIIEIEDLNALGQISMIVRGESGGMGIVKRPENCKTWQESGEATFQTRQ